ncbi:hypothetical protein CspHIS471_0204260 [Cutaneotrichosporon sp. HIS471]|nr:hypothetical protein CspHIS471_0204260 [Cutaneotrichosporon sp. HIS471]
MDRGAARSRKRTQKAEDKAKTTPVEDKTKLAKLLHKGKGKRERPPRKQKEPAGPDQYKAKAIRTARALVYAQEAFEIPPPPERLVGVTRVDLDGAECTDISWLPASVTWLSVKACPVTEGWDVIGALEGLTVLNISNCQLSALPPLAGLKGLKALVATGNEWTSLDDTVVAGWKELNSLNLSPLPLLRDVKANNLARLSTLPSHLPKWGTGNLDAVGKSGVGDGLEVLDLGNCSLPYSAVAGVFGLSATAHASKKAPRWAHLRSLTLRANPLTVEVSAYADQLQASPDLPKLQIIDARRVKERARAGKVQESRRDRKAREAREKKARPTGANEHSGGKEMRKWGADEAGEEKEKKEQKRSDAADEPEPKKRRHDDTTKLDVKKRKRDEKPQAEKRKREEPPADESSKKKRKRKHGKGEDKDEVLAVATPAKPVVVVKPVKQERAPVVAAVATHVAVADPAAQRAKKPGRSETAVVGVVDVAPARRGLDLKAALKEESGSGSGLGLRGW